MTQKLLQKIAIAADHGGFELKSALAETLIKDGYQTLDLGTDTLQSVDYPDYAFKLARVLIAGQAQRGVLVCGSGIGISIAANRFPDFFTDVRSYFICQQKKIFPTQKMSGISLSKDEKTVY